MAQAALHLKGGRGVQAIRWTFVGFCFVLFVFSVTVLVISSVNYAEMRVAFDELGSQKKYDFQSWQLHRFKPQAALGIFYFGMAFGAVFTLISFVGSCGAACLDRFFLTVFVISFSVVLFGTIITLAVITHIFREQLEAMANELFTEYINHLYGREDLLPTLMTRAINMIQRKQRCCGVLNTKDSDETFRRYGATSAQYTTLYWLESTQWGQIQAKEIGYAEEGFLLWAPISCCINERANCSRWKFGARLDDWNSTKEKYWTERIHVAGCGPYLLNFNHLEVHDRTKVIALAIFIITLFLITIVLACWLCQSLSSYEFSSQESELDQKRHRRRRRRKRGHRRHGPDDKHAGAKLEEVVVEKMPGKSTSSMLGSKSQPPLVKDVKVSKVSGKSSTSTSQPTPPIAKLGTVKETIPTPTVAPIPPAAIKGAVKAPSHPKEPKAKTAVLTTRDSKTKIKVDSRLASPAIPMKPPGLHDK